MFESKGLFCFSGRFLQYFVMHVKTPIDTGVCVCATL